MYGSLVIQQVGRVAYDADFVFRTLVSPKRDKATVSQPGMIQVDCVRYVSEALRQDGVMGTQVLVKVDNDDAGYVVAWVDKINDWVICEARNQYRVFSGVSRRVLHIARKIVLAEANGDPVDEGRWIESIERLSHERRITLQRLRDEERQIARTGVPVPPVRQNRCDTDASDEQSHSGDTGSDTFDRSWSAVGKPMEFTPVSTPLPIGGGERFAQVPADVLTGVCLPATAANGTNASNFAASAACSRSREKLRHPAAVPNHPCLLVALRGPAGVGKTTLLSKLVLKVSVGYTTGSSYRSCHSPARHPRRGGFQFGKPYWRRSTPKTGASGT